MTNKITAAEVEKLESKWSDTKTAIGYVKRQLIFIEICQNFPAMASLIAEQEAEIEFWKSRGVSSRFILDKYMGGSEPISQMQFFHCVNGLLSVWTTKEVTQALSKEQKHEN
jgi:hypothetical protein